MLKQFDTKRLIGLAYFENGFRHLTNNKHRVQTVAEMAGLKVRVQQSPSSVDFFESLNTNAIPMRSEEHTSELQSLMRISYAVFCLKKKKKQNITYTKLRHQ